MRWTTISDLRLVIILLFLIVSVPGIMITAYRFRQERQAKIQEVYDEARHYAELIAHEDGLTFDAAREMLILLSVSVQLRDRNSCSQFLRGILQQYPRYLNLAVADLRGTLICNAGPTPPNQASISDRDYFQETLLTRDFAVGGFAASPINNIPVIHFSYPVFTQAAEAQAVVAATIPLAALNDLERIVHPIDRNRYTLTKVNQSGAVLAHQPVAGEWILGEQAPELRFAENLLGPADQVFLGLGMNQERFIYASSPVETRAGNNGVYVILGIPESSALLEINRNFRNSILILLAQSLLGLFLALIAAYAYVLRPVGSLVRSATQMERGNFRARSGVPYEKAQLGKLAHAFDSMAATLEHEDARLRAAEAKFRTILESAPDAMVIADQSGILTMVNYQTEVLFGYQRDELVGNSVEILVPERFRKRHLGLRKEFLEDPETRSMGRGFDLYGLKKDGSEFPVEIGLSPLETEEGHFVCAAIRDVSERKSAEKLIRQTLDSLAEAQRISHVGSWTWDLATNETTQSEEMLRILGAPIDQNNLTLDQFLSFVHMDDRELLKSALKEALQEKEHFSFDFRIVRPDGSTRFLHAEADLYLDDAGRPVRMMGTDQDITEHRKAEEALQTATSKLRDLAHHLQSVREEERSRIARELHDEMGQSLSGLRMELYSIARRVQLTDTIMVESVQDSIRRIEEIILNVQRISAELRTRALELGLLTAIEWQAEELQSHTDINCTLDLPRSEVALDEEKTLAIFRIVQEALTNVARHSGATQVTISLRQPNNELLLEIQDNGKGIRESELNGIHSLGIAGMRERVHLLGGIFEIQAVPRKGTTVRVLIPNISNPD